LIRCTTLLPVPNSRATFKMPWPRASAALMAASLAGSIPCPADRLAAPGALRARPRDAGSDALLSDAALELDALAIEVQVDPGAFQLAKEAHEVCRGHFASPESIRAPGA
jgi:hypothetical protein